MMISLMMEMLISIMMKWLLKCYMMVNQICLALLQDLMKKMIDLLRNWEMKMEMIIKIIQNLMKMNMLNRSRGTTVFLRISEFFFLKK